MRELDTILPHVIADLAITEVFFVLRFILVNIIIHPLLIKFSKKKRGGFLDHPSVFKLFLYSVYSSDPLFVAFLLLCPQSVVIIDATIPQSIADAIAVAFVFVRFDH